MDQSKIARCPKCKNIIVTWNWFNTSNYIKLEVNGYKSNIQEDKWHHECWVCESVFETSQEVTNGVPYAALKALWAVYESGQRVRYTKAMKLLYENKKKD